MLLTIVLTLDTEKPVEYDRLFRMAMAWSAGDALGEVELVVLSQRDGPQSFDVHVSSCPRNRDGYPVWDLFADVREVWDQIHGDYVTFNHTEYMWGPDRLRRTLMALDQAKPVVALGNLRRTQRVETGYAVRPKDNALSRLLASWLGSNQFDQVTRWWDCFNGYPWLRAQEPGIVPWVEDVFFASRKWLDAIGFFRHGGRLPFQDVYDVMGQAMQLLERHELLPPILRLARDQCELVHLAHPKYWSAYTEATKDWFFSRRSDWAGTTFVREDLWQRLVKDQHPGQVIRDFRRAPGGTVTRWHSEFSGWLQNGGTKALLCRSL